MAHAAEYDDNRDHLVFDDAEQSRGEGGSWRPAVALRGADATGDWSGLTWNDVSAEEQVRPAGHDPLAVVREIPVAVSVELGRAPLTIRDLMDLGVGSVVTLDKEAGEPVDLIVNGVLVARGEVFVADGDFAVRVTEIVADTGAGHAAEENAHARAA